MTSRAAAHWTDPGWAALEDTRLWPRCWLLAEHSRRLARPGDFSVFDLGHRSAVVLRAEDLSLRAFANACPHRGTRLGDGVGCAKQLRCPYHGWTYALDGSLVAAPCVEPMPSARLVSLPVAERFGFAWVAFSPEVEPIDAFLAPLADDLARHDVGAFSVEMDVTVQLDCNWKLSAEVHTETLHVPFVHPEIAHTVNWKSARHTRHGPHARMALEILTDGPGDNVVLYVFPNVHLNLYLDRGFLLRHRPAPDRPDRTLVDHLVLARGPGTACPERRVVSMDDATIGPVLAQDFRMAERLQRGLATGAIEQRTFTEAEAPLAWMLSELERRIAT